MPAIDWHTRYRPDHADLRAGEGAAGVPRAQQRAVRRGQRRRAAEARGRRARRCGSTTTRPSSSTGTGSWTPTASSTSCPSPRASPSRRPCPALRLARVARTPTSGRRGPCTRSSRRGECSSPRRSASRTPSGTSAADSSTAAPTSLVNITNDAWSFSVPGAMQHMTHGRLPRRGDTRSVVRSTNAGMTCIIDPNGRILEQLPPSRRASCIGHGARDTEAPPCTRAGATGCRWVLAARVLAVAAAALRSLRRRRACACGSD